MLDVKDNLCFALWYGPQYRFAYGILTKQQVHIDWLEKLGLCDLKYTNIKHMFFDVAKHQGWDDTEGLAMTIISEDMYQDTMRIKHSQKEHHV